jgi:predicted nucleic acid-binding protein
MRKRCQVVMDTNVLISALRSRRGPSFKVLSLRLPNSIHDRVRVLSSRDHVSINQFVATAVAEKISAIETESYLTQRAQRASRDKFKAALAQIPDREPEEHDRF